ncbi:endonuclease V [Aquimarina rhabdastrellae]
MIYAFDTYYTVTTAKTVCLGFKNWTDETPVISLHETISEINDYESGAFYKRELPCILSILKQVVLQDGDILVIDGYVVLDDQAKLGLGGYLYHEFKQKYPVIGVAKNNFTAITTLKRAVLRGESKKALYITALGIDLDIAS